MIESSCLSNGIFMGSIWYNEKKFINEEEEKETLFLVLKRNTKVFYNVFLHICSWVAYDAIIKAKIKKFGFSDLEFFSILTQLHVYLNF